MAIHIALYEPDIPQNAGTMLRMAACLGLPVHIIEPVGFGLSDRDFKRAGMDYLAHVDLKRHDSFAHFNAWRMGQGLRLTLLSTKASIPYTQHQFQHSEILMVGRESAGVPEAVHAAVDARVLIPMHGQMRSLNVAISLAMVAGEALRQNSVS